MHLPAPRNSILYLRLDAPATLSGAASLVRVLRDTGYPHDLKVREGRTAILKAGRVFTPIIPGGGSMTVEAPGAAGAEVLALCANCFATMWRRALAWPAEAASLDELERAFWSASSAHACPRCKAAAARPH